MSRIFSNSGTVIVILDQGCGSGLFIVDFTSAGFLTAIFYVLRFAPFSQSISNKINGMVYSFLGHLALEINLQVIKAQLTRSGDPSLQRTMIAGVCPSILTARFLQPNIMTRICLLVYFLFSTACWVQVCLTVQYKSIIETQVLWKAQRKDDKNKMTYEVYIKPH